MPVQHPFTDNSMDNSNRIASGAHPHIRRHWYVSYKTVQFSVDIRYSNSIDQVDHVAVFFDPDLSSAGDGRYGLVRSGLLQFHHQQSVQEDVFYDDVDRDGHLDVSDSCPFLGDEVLRYDERCDWTVS